jgi:hypothetical protein
MKIGILCSGVALGVYIPAIYAYRDLKKRSNVSPEVFVLENLIFDDKKDKIKENKIAFHRNFSVARMGQRMAGDILPSVDPDKLAEIFETWINKEIHHFIVVSGFWVSVLEVFKNRYPSWDFSAECLHIDCVVSASWKKVNYSAPYYHSSWLVSHSGNKVVSELNMTELEPVPFDKRQKRFLAHGGGWGMGTYQSKIPELKKAGFALDIVAYEKDEIPAETGDDRYFMVNPHWSPWHRNADGEHTFPPIAQIVPGEEPVYRYKEAHHELLDVTREVIGVISKPGGATLLDSLAAATPLILLDNFGDYEAKNAELWISLGFGIYYEDWKKEGFSFDILKKMNENLMSARGKQPYFIDDYLKRIGGVILCSQEPR